MKRGPQPGGKPIDFLDKAQNAWPQPQLPAEVEALAIACNAATASGVAARIGYSAAVVSQVLARKYPGDITAVFARIRGALMAETLICPVLGEIGTDRCLSEQKRPFAATNSTRARLFHACKTCPNRRERMEALS